MTRLPLPHRPLSLIAEDIYADIRAGNWTAPSKAYALPYLRAMKSLDQITDFYMHDSAESVVLYFLANAGTWRGETSRRIKAELKSITA